MVTGENLSRLNFKNRKSKSKMADRKKDERQKLETENLLKIKL
jgi:hypothetical protein